MHHLNTEPNFGESRSSEAPLQALSAGGPDTRGPGATAQAPWSGVTGARPLHAYTPGDTFYEMLIESHRDLSDEQSRLVNARLVLLLANHIGDLRILREALAAARAGVATEPGATP